MPEAALLEVRGLDVHHGPGQVLHQLHLSLGSGSCLAVLGRNGMGKTTLVRTLMGLHPTSAGHVELDGQDLAGLDARARQAAGMALVAQGHRVFRSLTVAENLAVVRGADPARREAVLARFPILAERLDQVAADLSGGQQKMLMLGRALMAPARVVLMDEPSEGLDPTRVTAVAGAVRDLVADGAGVLLVEQRLAFALAAADEVAVMERGSLVAHVSADEARDDPASLRRSLGLA